MRKPLVRVELRDLSSHPSREDRERAFRSMFAAFKKQVNECGILSECKARQYYESPSEKKKRKKKEIELEKINNYFSNK